ncbi:MAG: hypothetical protein LBS56_00150 [Propionibacteriaceae bacterium]|nr:hypothetical protein [Propionibacteriaceae bacterium]
MAGSETVGPQVQGEATKAKPIRRPRVAVVVALAVVAVVLAVGGLRVARLNADWPPAVAHVAEPGAAMSFQGLAVTLTGAELIDGQNLSAALNGYVDSMQVPGGGMPAPEDVKGVIVRLDAVNDTSEPQTLELGYVGLRSGAWSSGVHMPAAQALSPGQVLNVEIPPGGRHKANLAFILYSFQFADGAWSGVGARSFELEQVDYPDKYVFQLPAFG